MLGDVDLPVETVFVGGGTPTLLSATDLGRVLDAIGKEFGLAGGAEVTTESNPETVDPAYLAGLREAGFTRDVASACRAPASTSWPSWTVRTRPAGRSSA